jgi:hypothetical protein
MLNPYSKVITHGRRALIAGALLALTAPSAQAQLVVYDDFSAPRIDASKWFGRQLQTRAGGNGDLLEVQREVTADQALVLQARAVGAKGTDGGLFTAENALFLRRPGLVNDIAFDVVVKRAEAAGCATAAASQAAARGVFTLFNDGEADSIAIVEVGISSITAAGGLTVSASLVRRTADTDSVLASLALGAANFGDQIKLRVRWDAAKNQVRFLRDGLVAGTAEYTNPVVSSTGRPKYLSVLTSVADCGKDQSSAAIVAQFDNVRINQ